MTERMCYNLDMITHKICKECGEEKELSEFSPSKLGKYGRTTKCKKCSAKLQKEKYWANPDKYRKIAFDYTKRNPDKISKRNRENYYADPEKYRARGRASHWANREKRLEQMREYYVENIEYHLERAKVYRENNPEKIAAYMKQWRADNKEYEKEYGRKYRLENKEAVKRRTKAWFDANPHMNTIYQHIRRARLIGAGGEFTPEEWEYLLGLCDYRCLVCGRTIEELESLGIIMTQDHIIPVSRGGNSFITNIQPLCKPDNSSKHELAVDYRSVFVAKQMEQLSLREG